MHLRSLLFCCALLIALPSLAAGPTDPVTVTPAPTDQGVIFSPGIRLLTDIAPDYVEEEFFISGAANNDFALLPLAWWRQRRSRRGPR